jgi:hypothetical protein
MKYNKVIRTVFKKLECVAFGSVIHLVDEKDRVDNQTYYLVSVISDYNIEDAITKGKIVLTSLANGCITLWPWGTNALLWKIETSNH